MALHLKAAQETGLYLFLKKKIKSEEKHFKLQKQGSLESPDFLQT